MDEDKHLKSEYLKYLMFLYHLEFDDGIDVGNYPTYEQFLVIRREERMTHCALR